MPRPKRKKKTTNRPIQEEKTISLIKQLEQFDWFQQTILPALRADLEAGVDASVLRDKYQSLVQAQMITTALVDPDAGKRIAASKDIIDRAEGKAKERKEVEHKLSRLDDEELNAVIKSQLDELEEAEKNVH